MNSNARQIIKDCMRITDVDVLNKVKILTQQDLSNNRCGSYEYVL